MYENYEQLTLKDVGSWAASGAMIFGGIIPYIPQYREIKRKEDAEGFSLYVCFTLLVANILRIFFWFGKHYETPLLLQSILMIITMMLMIKLCVKMHRRNQIIKAKERIFRDFDIKFFWKWTDFRSYVDFVLLFSGLGALIMYLLLDIPLIVETVGLLAVSIEAMLGLPQFLRNYNSKSTSGMSIAMVTMWTIGDAFKTCYFVQREAPIQFQTCGALQVIIDIAILAQVYIYQNRAPLHPRAPVRLD